MKRCKQIFNKHYSHFVREGIIKSVLCGLIIGFAIIFVVACVSWCCNYNLLWLGIGLMLGSTIIGGAIFYFAKFHPTSKLIARRIDELGLEERLITMMDLEQDESYIAIRQREDANKHLSMIDKKQMKFKFPSAIVAPCVTLALLCSAMTSFSILSFKGIAPSFNEIFNRDNPTYVEISYVVEEGGEIDGEANQVILVGESATPVTAIAEEGWVFVEWDDGSGDPYRDGDKVNEDTVFTAVFEKIDNESGQDGQPGDGEGMPSDGLPGEPQPGKSDGNSPIDPNAPPSDGAGGDDSARNQIINGDTMYLPLLDDYAQDARDSAANDGNISDALRQIIDTYFDTLG